MIVEMLSTLRFNSQIRLGKRNQRLHGLGSQDHYVTKSASEWYSMCVLFFFFKDRQHNVKCKRFQQVYMGIFAIQLLLSLITEMCINMLKCIII